MELLDGYPYGSQIFGRPYYSRRLDLGDRTKNWSTGIEAKVSSPTMEFTWLTTPETEINKFIRVPTLPENQGKPENEFRVFQSWNLRKMSQIGEMSGNLMSQRAEKCCFMRTNFAAMH